MQTRWNWTEIAASRSEVTYPLPRLLLLGPIFRSPGQRDGVGSERIFERPPLPWRVSRGATGVKTPDNQSGILKSRGQQRYKKQNKSPKNHTHTHKSLVERKPRATWGTSKACGTDVQQGYSAQHMTDASTQLRADSWPNQRGLTVSGLSRFEAKQRQADSPVDRPVAKCAWGRG